MNIKTRIYNFINTVAEDNVYMYAAQASFYIIISAIPFFMLLLSLATLVLPVSESDIMIIISPLLPDVVLPSIESIIHEIFNKVSGSVISISAISSIWTASRGFQAIERGTRNVYHSPKRTALIFDFLASFLYTASFIFIMILFLTVFVFGNSIINSLELRSGIWHWIFSKTAWLKWIFSFILLTASFSVIYMTFSGKKLRPRNHIPGALFTTSVWMLFSFIFSFYIENFANYSYIYGSLAALVLLMLWVYCCMIIFLIGCEINMRHIRKNTNNHKKHRAKFKK